MKKALSFCLVLCMLLGILMGCGTATRSVDSEPSASEQPTVASIPLEVEVLPTVNQFSAQELAPEPERETWYAPSRQDGRLQLRCLVRNEGMEALTLSSFQVTCYRYGQVISQESYGQELLGQFLRPADSGLTLTPGDSTLLTFADSLSAELFDEAHCIVTLLDEKERKETREFRFTTDPEKVTPPSASYEGGWDPVVLGDSGWVFFSVLRNDTDAPLYLEALHIISYQDGVPVQTSTFPASSLNSQQTAQIGELSPGEVVTYSDAYPADKDDFNQRELTFLYRYAQGQPQLQTFRFRMDEESAVSGESSDAVQVIESVTGIPGALGKAQYTSQQIRDMVEEQLTLEEVAERISTVADLAQYLHECRYGMANGDLSFEDGGVQWHVNASAHSTFYENKGNAGGCSNLINYLLRGDYEEQGYFVEVTYRGAHIHSYVKQGGVCYFLDLPESMMDQIYNISHFRMVAATSLEAYGAFRLEQNHAYNKPTEDFYTVIQYLYPWEGNHRPLGLEETFTILPSELRDTVTVLYNDDRFAVQFAEAPPYALWPPLAQ